MSIEQFYSWPADQGFLAANEIVSDPGRRVGAKLAGWKFPMSVAEIYQRRANLAVLNMMIGKNDTPATTIWPWELNDSEPEYVSSEEKQDLSARLASVSVFE